MKRMRTALGRAIVVSIVVLAVAPASSALAGTGVRILSPSSGSSSLDAAPVFSGTTNATTNVLTLLIYPGGSATGTPLQTLSFEPLFPEEAWMLTPAALGEGTYTAVALQAGELGEPGESEPVTFTVEAAPVIQTNPVSATVTAGETATFTAAASGTPAPSVQWEVSTDHGATWASDTADAGNTTDTLSVSSVSLAQSGYEYRALFTNSAGSQESEAATLTVHTPPVIALNPQNATLTAGETATFTAAASGSPTPTVQWQVSSDHGSSWSADTSDAGNRSDTLTVAAVTLAQSGDEYRALFTNAAGSQASEPATLIVQTPPTVTQNPQNATATAGETATFKAAASGSPTPTVQWQVSSNHGSSWTDDTEDSGNRTDTLTVAAAASAQNGYEYRALFTNAAGSQESGAATLTVQVAPTVTTNPQNATVHAGETATFKAAASGTPTPAVQWEVSSNHGSSWAADTADAGNKTDTLKVASVTLAQSGYEYRAVFSNVVGSRTSSAATLTVQTAPAVTLNPVSATLTAGETATFTAAASGSPTPSVQWQVSSNGGSSWAADTDDAGSTTDTLTVASVTLAQSGYEYRAVFTNVVGSQASSAATLTVQSGPAVTTQPVSVTRTEGETATFTAAASGSPTPSVQWQVSSNHGSSWANDTSDAGNTTDTLTVASVTLAENGYEYRALFTNAEGSRASDAATLTVQTLPAVTLNPVSATLIVGETATFSAAASGTPAPSVQWQVSSNHGSSWAADTSDAGSTTDTLTVASVTLAQSGDEYRALFTNAAGSKVSSAATLIVQSVPVVTTQPVSVTRIEGEAATFTAAAEGTPAPSVQWQVSTDQGTTWAPDIIDAGNKTDTLTVASVTLAQSGDEYRALFTNGAGSQTSEPATLTVHAPPAVTLNPVSATVTAGEAVTFTAAASGVPTPTVQWQVSTDQGTTWAADTADAGNRTDTLTVASVTLAQSGNEYRAVFTNGVGKSATSGEATLTVHVAPVVTQNPRSVLVSNGETTTFTAAAEGTPAPTVQWEVSSDQGGSWAPDTEDAGNTTETLTVAKVTYAQSGYEYRAVFTNAAGSQASEPATLLVRTPPKVTASPDNTTAFEGETASFTAAASGVPAPTVQWEVSSNFGSTWTPDASDPGSTSGTLNVAATLAKNGYEYRAVFTNELGTVKSEPAIMLVQPAPPAPPAPQAAPAVPAPDAPPVASFVWLPRSPHVGEAVSLASNSTDASSAISAFAWDPKGDGPLLAGGPVLSTSFATAGAHTVRLQVTAADGLSSVVSATITVYPRELALMAPFPIVRLAGSYGASGVKISLLNVQAPAGAHITVSCRGRGCPRHSETRLAETSSTRANGVAQVGFQHFERGLSPGAVLQIRIYKAGEIGKYTSFTVRRGKLPLRVDACLDPSGQEPIACPT